MRYYVELEVKDEFLTSQWDEYSSYEEAMEAFNRAVSIYSKGEGEVSAVVLTQVDDYEEGEMIKIYRVKGDE